MRMNRWMCVVALAAACTTPAPAGTALPPQDTAAAAGETTASPDAGIDAPAADRTGADAAAVDSAASDVALADGVGPDAKVADSTGADAGVVEVDAAAAETKAEVTPDTAADVAPIGPNQCSSEQPCNGKMCLAPGQTMPCGMCFKVDGGGCTADKECSPPATVCKPQKCACGGESTCQPGCKVAADCAEGFFCAPTGKCVEDVCLVVDPPGKDKSCKPNFVCKNPSNPHCFRKTCTQSSECQGHCVGGLCYAEPGACIFPPP